MNQFCIVCGGTLIDPRDESLAQCRTCGYIFAPLDLTDVELTQLYDHNFFADGAFADYAADRKYLTKNFHLRLQELRRHLDPARHQNLLEIGSAYGFFLDAARAEFRRVQGIDITDEGVRYTREQLSLPAVQGDFLEHDFGAEKFDVVCMWDTIEHVRRPDLYLEKIAAHTSPGALLAITTGDIGSLNARLRGQHWRMIIPPIHAHYFSRATLERLLRNHGFEVSYNRYCGFYRGAANVAYIILALRHGRRKLFERVQQTGLLNWGFYLNMYDIMYVIARKR